MCSSDLNYSRRKLTSGGDSLSAIAGIVLLFGKFSTDKYPAGNWKEVLIRQMLWHAEDNDWLSRHFKDYRAPTWSWASLGGAITFF